MTYQFWVYILKCSDGSYYVGVTNNLLRRMHEHESGVCPHSYTSTRRPLELVYSEQFTDILLAIKREKQLKGWTRKKKEALIAGDLSLLKKL